MGVGGIGKAEVAAVFWLVHGLLHGAQEHHLNQLAVGAIGSLGEKRGVIQRSGFVAAAEAEAEQAELLAQGGELFRRGAGVVAE